MKRKTAGMLAAAFLGVSLLLPAAGRHDITLGELAQKKEKVQAYIFTNTIAKFYDAEKARPDKISQDRAVCIDALFNPTAKSAYKTGPEDSIYETLFLTQHHPELRLGDVIWQFITDACHDGSKVPVEPSILQGRNLPKNHKRK